MMLIHLAKHCYLTRWAVLALFLFTALVMSMELDDTDEQLSETESLMTAESGTKTIEVFAMPSLVPYRIFDFEIRLRNIFYYFFLPEATVPDYAQLYLYLQLYRHERGNGKIRVASLYKHVFRHFDPFVGKYCCSSLEGLLTDDMHISLDDVIRTVEKVMIDLAEAYRRRKHDEILLPGFSKEEITFLINVLYKISLKALPMRSLLFATDCYKQLFTFSEPERVIIERFDLCLPLCERGFIDYPTVKMLQIVLYSALGNLKYDHQKGAVNKAIMK